jgi:hypothetical protein
VGIHNCMPAILSFFCFQRSDHRVILFSEFVYFPVSSASRSVCSSFRRSVALDSLGRHSPDLGCRVPDRESASKHG